MRTLVGGLALVLIALNTVLHCMPLFLLAVLKALLPLRGWRSFCNYLLVAIAESWIAVNSLLIDRLTHTRLDVAAEDAAGQPVALQQLLSPQGRYLVFANHQSWVDIPILQKLLNRKAPFMRFFLKSQLIWVPLLGLAWWALDFPFMKRYSRAQIAARPELAGVDVGATRRACARFADQPVSIMNFVEGTRFTSAKHAAQRSPYQALLKPRAGGIAFVLAALGDSLHGIIDITLHYPNGRPSMLDLLHDRVGTVQVEVRLLPIPESFRGFDYQNDADARERFQGWLNSIWQDKDQRLATMGQPSTL